MRLLRIQDTMTYNQRLRITLMQIYQQTSQRTLLCWGSGIARSLAVSGKPTHISHPNGVPVMVLAMRPHHLLRPARFNGPIRRNHVVVATANPAQVTVPPVDVRHSKGTARLVGGAVHNNQRDRSHSLRVE